LQIASSGGILEHEPGDLTCIVEGGIRLSALRDALSNLLLNALQASTSGGRVTLLAAVANGELLISVQDSGPGVPDGLRERIWEPFFTTRQRGTGLGLAIAKWAVDMHGGQITVEQRPGGGSEFRILLPLASSVEITDEQNTTQLRIGG